jgi:hypothetical protein
MFAHQVIKDLRHYSSEFKKGCLRCQASKHSRALQYDSMIPGIIESQKFHMGDIYALYEMFLRDNDKDMFMGDNVVNMELPYSNMWITTTRKRELNEFVTKEAVWITKITDIIWFVVHFKYLTDWRWIPLRVASLVVVGGMTQEINQFLEKLFPKKVPSFIGSAIVPIVCEASLSQDFINEEIKSTIPNLYVLQNTIKLLNCKNIQTERISAPQQLNKKRIRSGKLPIYDYHVLNLVLPSNKNRGYQEQSVPLSHNRVHLCRGHFKEYTKEHPLFGKYAGLYWWEPSVRGQNRDGIVMKDYSVKPAS